MVSFASVISRSPQIVIMDRIRIAMGCLSIWLLIVSAFASISHSVNLSQKNKTSNQVARKFDEYRINDLGGHDEQMRLWSAFDEFVKETQDARLIIIAYGELPGRARRHANRAKNYLVNAHGVIPTRIVAVDGGFQADAFVEIWIVPAGAQDPIPRPNGTFGQNVNDAWKYDELSLQGWWFGDYGSCCERQPERLDGFAAALGANPQAKGFIIVHSGTFYCETCLRPGTELRFAQREKDYLTRTHQIAALRVRIKRGRKVDGGGIELWVVPSGARLPRRSQSVAMR